MPVIEIPRGLAIAQVEIPDQVGRGEDARPTARSCKGSIHLRPGIKFVTNDELAVVASALPKHGRRIRVVSETKADEEEKKAVEVLAQERADAKAKAEADARNKARAAAAAKAKAEAEARAAEAAKAKAKKAGE